MHSVMKGLSKILVVIFLIIDAILAISILVAGKNLQILNPQGLIAFQERNLFYLAVTLMLFGAVPVFILAFFVAARYHADNKKAAYRPEWDHHTGLQIFFWGFLIVIISILSVLVWVSAHQLDPHKAIEPDKKPFVVQVFALRYKWLFVYPTLGVASLNYLVIPEKTPVTFEITAYDTPMNSFWIPQLGGQIYAMSGMATQTHLMADGPGVYRGASSEINGEGYADMVFTAKSMSGTDFNMWVSKAKKSPTKLTTDSFYQLAKPSVDKQIVFYSSTPDNLFSTIVMHYMAHPSASPVNNMNKMEGM